ncbi:MAG: hypothetical protein KIT09_06840 [Bryobacteraceae bacterium]|nr:hypothetical protein [Bryobacteraceae bacterium]
MRRSLTIAVILCAAVAGAVRAADSVSMPSIWRYTHPDAKALIGIEWSRALHSPIGQQLRAKLQESDFGERKGLELIDEIQRILISSPGNTEAGHDGHAPAVVAVQGNFDLDKIRELAMPNLTKAVSYQSVEILERRGDDGATMALALVSPQTILVGDAQSVRTALDHYLAVDAAQAANPLFARAAELAANNDIWIVAKASPADFAGDGAEPPPFLNDIETVEAGIALQNGLGLELNLGSKSAESAQALAGALQFMLGMAMAKREPGMPDFSEKLYISTDGALVHIAFSLDGQELETALAKIGPELAPQLAAMAGDRALLETAANGHEEQLPPPPPPEKRVIRIYGLEEGVREIPFNP